MPFDLKGPISSQLTTVEQLEKMAAEWRALWQSCPTATPFQSPGWVLPWIKFFGKGELWNWCLRVEGRLVGVACFCVHQPRNFDARQLQLAGTGISDYLDVLVQPGLEHRGLFELFDLLAENQDRWDICDFQELRADSVLFSAETPAGWFDVKTVQGFCPILRWSEGGENLSQFVPKLTLEKLHYYRRRAGKAGIVHIEAASQENFQNIFSAFLHLHSTRWNRRGKSGVLAETAIQNFHREAAQNFLQLGALRLYALRLNHRLIGALYCFKAGRRIFYYLSGFDPEFSQFSPGTLLIGHAIEQAVRENAVEFDFLRGEEKYKYLWGAKNQVNYRRQFWRKKA